MDLPRHIVHATRPNAGNRGKEHRQYLCTVANQIICRVVSHHNVSCRKRARNITYCCRRTAAYFQVSASQYYIQTCAGPFVRCQRRINYRQCRCLCARPIITHAPSAIPEHSISPTSEKQQKNSSVHRPETLAVGLSYRVSLNTAYHIRPVHRREIPKTRLPNLSPSELGTSAATYMGLVDPDGGKKEC